MVEDKIRKMITRRTILVGLTVLVSLTISLTFDASAQTMSIDPVNIEANHEDSFTIDITVDPEGTAISGAQYVLRFDSRILNATSQTQGSFFGGIVVANDIDNPNGTVNYGEYETSGGVTNPGVLASVTFEVVGTSGTSHLILDGVVLSDPDGNEIQGVTKKHGSFSIKYEADDPTPAPQPVSVNPIVAEEAHQMMEESLEEIIHTAI
jgi:hypothetical protein